MSERSQQSTHPGQQSKRSKRNATSSHPANKAKRVKKDIWDPVHVMSSQNSPLVNVDLREILAKEEAFDLLDAGEKAKLIKMLPNDFRHVSVGKDKQQRIDPEFLKNDTNWHHAVSCVREDILDGRNDPRWLSQAYKAHKQRAAGNFDSWKESELEEFWGLRHAPPLHILQPTEQLQNHSDDKPDTAAIEP